MITATIMLTIDADSMDQASRLMAELIKAIEKKRIWSKHNNTTRNISATVSKTEIIDL